LVPFRDQIVRIFYEIYDDADTPDITALGRLRRLAELALHEGVETIDFSGLQALETLSCSGDTPRFGNLREARALRTLHIVNGGLRDLTPLAGLDQLTRLHVSESKLQTVVGIEELRSLQSLALTQVSLDNLEAIVAAPWLRELHLYMPRRLQSIAPLVGLPLRVLSIGGTRKIGDIERLTEVAGLEALELEGVGKLSSLSFLRGLRTLERFALIEATVEDGDMGVLLELPALRRVVLQKRRHYTHAGDEVQAVLTARWTKGLTTFDNASAGEWIAILWQRQPIAWLNHTINDVLAYQAERDVPAIAGQFAIAAAEVIARLRGRGDGTPAPEPLVRWLAQHALDPPPQMVTNAQAALDRILAAPSGLLRLWAERGQAEAWKAAVENLKRRLAWEPGT